MPMSIVRLAAVLVCCVSCFDVARSVDDVAVPAKTGNRFAYLDECNPWYPDKDFPKLITPQWVGEEGVECVVVLAIDDMRDTAKYEQYLRPILNRLKQIDGRAPVSIMTCEVRPDDPQLQSWLGEGLSIECHTIDHPCPLFAGDFAKIKSTCDRCVDLMGQIPGNKPVAFRTPCCDSLNTVSPRFYSEIFSSATANGNILQIDSSVMNFFTSEDKTIPRDLVLDADGSERFWKYKVHNFKRGETVHDNFVNYIRNYPYPYVINNSCWQFPCVAPSDWSAQHLHGVNNPITIEDWKAALDITVHKQGVFNLVFHPHGWIRPEQVVELIDHAVAKHGKKVKFLNFREAAERLENAGSGKLKAERSLLARTVSTAAISALFESVPQLNEWRAGGSIDPPCRLMPIRRPDGSHNGFFTHDRHFCWINEDTAHLPDLMYRVSFDEILAGHEKFQASGGHQPAGTTAPQSDSDRWADATPLAEDRHFDPVPIGAAVVDITPDYPVRLTGYGDRTKESDGVAARLHARALVIGGELASGGRQSTGTTPQPKSDRRADATPLAILITVDNCGVPLEITEAVFARAAEKHGIARERFAISSTHSHSAPWLRGFAPNILSAVTDDQSARLAQYETELIEKLVRVVDQAIAARQPGHLSYGFGEAGFAMNRRVLSNGKWTDFGEVPDGPTDNRVPVLAAHDVDGKLIAVLANYACHCTTETGEFNQISGDWAGFATDMLEADHPGAVALIAIGCGADANPSPRGTHEQAHAHARTMANEVTRILSSGGRQPAGTTTANPSGSASPDSNRTGGLTPSARQIAIHRIDPNIACNMARIDLPLGPLPSRADWELKAKDSGVAGMHARHFLKMLEEGKEIPKTISDYPVQTWCFGDDLAMVFLGGEVVVDYSIRMNDMFDGDRLWINAYSNDVPCYIASARLLREGGYECDSSMLYYRRPTRLAPEAEDVLCDAVQKLMPHEFYSEKLQQDFPAPKSPEESLRCMTTKPDLRIVLAASEPLIRDPVAFDWDESGRLWVVEMGDYPLGESPSSALPRTGGEGTNQSAGRIRLLEDTDKDNVYDKATTFLDGLAFPNGIQCWRGGVIVTMAPEIFYAEDTDGDGAADVRKTLYQGFVEGNQQHRVNGLRWGLDGWLYLANGDSGGEIAGTGYIPGEQASGGRQPAGTTTAPDAKTAETSTANRTGGLTPSARQPVSLRGRDLRIHPDTNGLDTVSGQTQFGRERDDFGNWFGNNNSNPIYQYVLEDRYVRRNPHAGISQVTAQVSEIPGAAPVYPTSRTLARFNEFGSVNRFTSACSTMIYRDDYLGEQYYGNAFTSEPVHNLVSRLVLTRDGYRFSGRRAPDEQESEFLASSDNWFRPTMIRTGPDGALWVADMYRAVIEHPEWIPPEYQRKMNLYAGNDRGRIWRIVPANECCSAAASGGRQPAGIPTANPSEPIDAVEPDTQATNSTNAADANRTGGLTPDRSPARDGYFEQPWNEISIADLVRRLKSPNGWWRDTADRILQHRRDMSIRGFSELAQTVISDTHPAIRLQSVRISAEADWIETELRDRPEFSRTCALFAVALFDDENSEIRRRAIQSIEVSLRHGSDDQSRELIAALTLLANDPDPAVRLQLMLSLGEATGVTGAKLLGRMMHENSDDHFLRSAGLTSLTPENIGVVLREVMSVPADDLNEELLGMLLAQAAAMGKGDQLAGPLKQLVATIHADSPAARLEISGNTLSRMISGTGDVIKNDAGFIEVLKSALDSAIISARDGSHDEDQRSAAIRFVDIAEQFTGESVLDTTEFFTPQTPQAVQLAAANVAAQRANNDTIGQLLSHWSSFPPAVRIRVIATFLSREPTTKMALDAVESNQISGTDFDATQRDGLLNHRNDEIRTIAKKLFGEESPSARSSVVEDFRFQISNLKSDAVAGRAVFEKRCSTCHRLQDIGKDVGADLAALKDRSTDAMLTAILDPNRAVESKFLVYTVVTKDGLQHVGMLKGETGGSLTLIGNDGKEQTVVRADIEELVASKRSLMPEGLEKDLSGQDLANVIEFVQSTGTPWKRFDGNTPQFVAANADETITLPASAAEIYGPNLVFEPQFGNLGYWSTTEDFAKWTFEVPKSGHWTVEFDFACDDSAAGSLIRLSTGGRMLTARVPGSGTWDHYQIWQAGTIDLRRGRNQLTITTPEPPAMALIDLRAIRLIPPK